jgi:hypothetical protein
MQPRQPMMMMMMMMMSVFIGVALTVDITVADPSGRAV